MHTPSYSIPLPVDTLWHTNWGFAVRQIIDDRPYNYFFDGRIAGSHRDYAEQFILPGQRREHEYRPRDSEGTPSPLLPGTTAFIRAQITSTLDHIPLDPTLAGEDVREIWQNRIEQAKKESRPSLIEYRDILLSSLQSVMDGRVPNILDLRGIIGICCEMRQGENKTSHT